jgi:RNA polymerase sigma-70 factor (ECF subfamily)
VSQPSEREYVRLVEPHRDELRAHCYRLLRSHHDAEDAVQEALVRAWRGLGAFEGRGSLRSWLYRIATNASIDAMKRRDEATPASEPAPAGDRTSAEDPHEQREAIELTLAVALEQLPPRQVAVLILRAVLGFSARETADLLHTTEAAVNSALQRARARLREARELSEAADELAA